MGIPIPLLLHKTPHPVLIHRFPEFQNQYIMISNLSQPLIAKGLNFSWIDIELLFCSVANLSKQSRIQGRCLGPPLFLDQTEAQTAEKNFF